jgi:RecJ-like exonuclease
MSRVAIYGAIGDYKEKTTLMQKLMEDWDKSALYYEAGTLLEGLEIDRKDYDFMRRIARLLSKNTLPSSDNELVSKARQQAQLEEKQRKNVARQVKTIGNIAYVIDVPGSIGTAALYARVTKEALIGVAGETKHEIVDLSLRSKSPNIDLNVLLRSECRKFGGVGGGHPQAAGARIPVDQLIGFLKSLDLTATSFLES